MVVCHRQLAYILREGGGQLTAGANVSEHYIGNGIGSFATSEPYIQDGGDMLIFLYVLVRNQMLVINR